MGWMDGLQQNNMVRSVVRNARQWESDMDSDHDGSIADQIGRGLHDHVPVLGNLVGQPLEDVGDAVTDALGTRDQGIFSHQGTLDVKNTTDTDYADDGVYAPGVGQAINGALGLNVDPAIPAAMVAGSLTGGVGSLAVLENEIATEASGGQVPSATREAANWVRDVPDLVHGEI